VRRHELDVVHDNGYGWFCDVFQPHGGSRRASFEQNLLLSPRLVRGVKRQAARWLTRHDEFRKLVDRQYSDPQRIYMPISRMVAGHMMRYHGVPAHQMRLVYNGVDLQRFSPEHRDTFRDEIRQQLGIRSEQVMLLIVAHNFRLKGVRTLLRAAARLSAGGKDLHVVIVGGKHLDFWQRRAKWMGLAERVSFLGRIDDPVPYYAAADAYVQPTFYDPCSLVVLEALASGLPVVTSRFNGVSELLTHGREGYVICDPADHHELAEALLPMFNPARRAAMGQAARALALQHPLERNCREILEVYREIVGRRLSCAA
jgi:UDP-glucose:(heptosyl)LPS alpha-1,3-glucosyltransferase